MAAAAHGGSISPGLTARWRVLSPRHSADISLADRWRTFIGELNDNSRERENSIAEQGCFSFTSNSHATLVVVSPINAMPSLFFLVFSFSIAMHHLSFPKPNRWWILCMHPSLKRTSVPGMPCRRVQNPAVALWIFVVFVVFSVLHVFQAVPQSQNRASCYPSKIQMWVRCSRCPLLSFRFSCQFLKRC